MNQVRLIGEVAWPVVVERDPVTRRPVVNTVLAVHRGVHGPSFIPITLRGDEALSASKHLGEGSLVAVDGHIRTDRMATRDAHGVVTRWLVSIIPDRVTYLRVRPPRAGDLP